VGFEDGSTRERGRAVEQLVAGIAEQRGVEILDRNFEAAGAELDLVGRIHDGTDDVIVFVEIRSRSRDELGSPLETVDARKQRQIIRAATAWLVRHDLWDRVAARFDVVGVVGEPDEDPQVEWVENAFEAE
jgi:putative endonuclease